MFSCVSFVCMLLCFVFVCGWLCACAFAVLEFCLLGLSFIVRFSALRYLLLVVFGLFSVLWCVVAL